MSLSAKAHSYAAMLKAFLTDKWDAAFNPRIFVGAEHIRSDTDNGLYIRAVENANHNFKAFLNFKRNKNYRAVLEHVSYEEGREYLEILRSEAPDFAENVDRFLINDIVGNPVRFFYEGAGLVSPTTFRYLKVASDLRQLFGDLNGVQVGEIGVGYGGQLLILDQIFEFRRYDLYDLPPVLRLTSRYLESHLLNSSYRTTTLNQCGSDISYDLVLSNYAFSELPAKLASKYVEKVLSKARRAYLTMNSGRGTCWRNRGKLSIEDYRNLLPAFEIKEERPLTGADNYILVWGHK
jgi:putative sugar O-methyltransferase